MPTSLTAAGAQGRAVSLLEQVAEAGLWTLDAETGQVRWSEGMAALLGAPLRWTALAPAPLESNFTFVLPAWRAQVQGCLARALREGGDVDLMVQIMARGQPHWSRLRAQPVRDAQGLLVRLEGVMMLVAPAPGARGAVITFDAQARINHVSEPAEALLARPAARWLGRSVWTLFQKTAQVRIERAVREALALREPLEIEEPDASQERWLSLRAEPFAGGMAASLRDVTRRHQSQEQLRLLESSIARLNDLVIITEATPFSEPGPRIVFVNEAFERRTGYSRQEVVGRSPRLLQGPQTQRDRLDDIRRAIEQWRAVRVELVNYRKDGEPFWVDLDISPVWDQARRLTHWVAVGRDITDRMATDRKIRHLAFYDTLTGLPNRQLLLERLQSALAPAANAHGGVLMFIDLDNFKSLNDTMGHQRGDELLQQVAVRLRGCVAETDTVARLGGDEFVVLMAPRGTLSGEPGVAAGAVAHRILAALSEPYSLSGHVHHSTCSIGVTLFHPTDGPVSELLKQADLAMYQAKRSGRHAVCFFDPRLQAAASASASLSADLRHAWREGQFLLDYQPQVTGDGGLIGVEALLRWAHPQRGQVPPDEFIRAAEESSLIVTLGRWVLDAACAQLAAWSCVPDRAHLSISVNVSARQFRQPDFVEDVMEAIQRAGITPSLLKLELTETLLVDEIEVTLNKMSELKGNGVALSLDDFGMGYSSLSYLKRLPLDQLKIDREFVKDLLTDPNDAAIASTIINLARSLGLDVIAEGVENEAQREFLATRGCTSFQGFLYSRPLPIEQLEAFIDAR